MAGRVNLAFAGCGFLGLYHTGVVAALRTHGSRFLDRVDRYSGASAGSLNAVVLACDVPIEKSITMGLRVASKIRSNLHKIPWQNLDAELRKSLEEILPPNAHSKANDRLFVSVTFLNPPSKFENKLLSKFSTRAELIEALAQSCYIPLYSGFGIPKEGNQWAIDGAYSDNLPIFHDLKNIKVSPFVGESVVCSAEISPKEENTSVNIVYRNTPFALTASNFRRIARVVLPPSLEEMKSLYISGYTDGKMFLKKEGFFDTATPPNVMHLFREE